MPNNETIFFQNLEKVVGEQFIKAKSLSKPITKYDVFLDKNYISYHFSQEINKIFISILKELLSNSPIPKGSLSHNIDGLIYHPIYRKRIIEFDEEQHFNPFKKATLKYLSEKIIYKQTFLQHCNDITCYNRMVKKHRIKKNQKLIPQNTVKFQEFIENNKKNNNGYIIKVNGFDFWGGRIAQRAYYDILRDYAHLSEYNIGLSQSMRFSLFEIENNYCKRFEHINDKEIQDHIIFKLKKLS